MTITFNPPTDLQGTVSGYTADLTWLQAEPLDPTTSLLLHFDGTNGSTDIVDSSGNNLPITVVGTSIETSTVQFGTGALTLPSTGTPAYVSTPIVANGPLDLSLGDFTIEMFVNFNYTGGGNYGEDPTFFYDYNGGVGDQNVLEIYANAPLGETLGIHMAYEGNGVGVNASFNTWTHVAVVRYTGDIPGSELVGNIMCLYVGGVYVGYIGIESTTNLLMSGTTLEIGCPSNVPVGGFSVYGYIDELRVTKGVALYQSNFTPPTAPFSTGPPGYDVYRDGVSIGTFLGTSLSYDDTVPTGGIYTYNVAAWDGTEDISDLSDPLVLDINAPVIPIYGKFVGPSVYKPVLIGDSAGIEPRIWKPKENNTVQP